MLYSIHEYKLEMKRKENELDTNMAGKKYVQRFYVHVSVCVPNSNILTAHSASININDFASAMLSN